MGKIVKVCSQTLYERPDKSTYKETSDNSYQAVAKAFYEGVEKNEQDLLSLPLNTPVNVYKLKVGESLAGDQLPIYKLIARENRVGKGQVHRCYEHKDEWQQRGFKGYNQMRHWWETYNSTEATIAIYKLSLDGKETLLAGLAKTELLLTMASRDSGRTNKAECAPNGQNYPANSRVVPA